MKLGTDAPGNYEGLLGESGRQFVELACGRQSASEKLWSKRRSASSRRDNSRTIRKFLPAPSTCARYSISFNAVNRITDKQAIGVPYLRWFVVSARRTNLLCRFN